MTSSVRGVVVQGAGVSQGMKQIKRHMIVTRSGPTGAEYELEVTRMEVAKALWQFRTEDPEQVSLFERS